MIVNKRNYKEKVSINPIIQSRTRYYSSRNTRHVKLMYPCKEYRVFLDMVTRQNTVVNLCTVCFNTELHIFHIKCVCVFCIFLTKTAIISLNSMRLLAFLMVTQGVYCEVELIFYIYYLSDLHKELTLGNEMEWT
jgi:hypothetical protein